MADTPEDKSHGEDESNPAEKLRLTTGVIITFLAIGMFFWWGSHFHIFGSRIQPTPPYLGFIFWILVGAFGVGFSVAGLRAGLKAAGQLACLFLIAICVGVMLGHYR